jgi:glycosyltransferase involved in cell wall biosynthesis
MADGTPAGQPTPAFGGGRVAVVLKGWPRLSETFIAQELAGLEARGLDLLLVSLRRPTDTRRHATHDRVRAPVSYLPEYLHEEPARVLRGLVGSMRLAGFGASLGLFLRDLARDPTRNRVRRFGQAAVLAAELPADVTHLYAHFLHTPASVARYAARLRGLPWSVSAHAKDIWTSPDWEKREKLADCAWAVTCTEHGAAHLSSLAPEGRVRLVHHGLDPSRFPPPPPRPGETPRDGSNPDLPVRLLAVGRAVEKKGLDDLVEALALLPPTLAWRLTHVGAGPLAGNLAALAEARGVAERIDWLGARTEAEVLALYREADLLVTPSRIAGDGDRDGLPNVLVEAQSQGVAVLTTPVSGIPELVTDGLNGVMVPPGDPTALAGALARLIADPAARARMGDAGRELVARRFDAAAGLDLIAGRLACDAARTPITA